MTVQAKKDKQSKFDAYYAQIREPKKMQAVTYAPGSEERIVQSLRRLGTDVSEYVIDVDDYKHYLLSAQYSTRYPGYYSFNLAEKSLEHYIAEKLLDLNASDVYIDIASEHSPVPEIYHRLFGGRAYRQDFEYTPGLHGDRIGGDAATKMPVQDGFATKMALHSSLEHFQGDSDTRFLREVMRVLKLGGAVSILPLYSSEEYAIQTDPLISVPASVTFEDNAVLYRARAWNNRHGRFYDPKNFAARTMANLKGLTANVFRIMNSSQVDKSCYARFAMLIRKPEK